MLYQQYYFNNIQSLDISIQLLFGQKKKLATEMNYGIGKSEMLAIVKACKQWRYYVKNATHCFTIITNHTNLQQFFIDKA